MSAVAANILPLIKYPEVLKWTEAVLDICRDSAAQM
jgi:hypothetical protein